MFRNDAGTAHYLRLKTVGLKSNKDGIGAKITVVLPDGAKQTKTVKAGSGYCSQNELPVTFGLGANTKAQSVTVQWPSNKVTTLHDVPANQTLIVKE